MPEGERQTHHLESANRDLELELSEERAEILKTEAQQRFADVFVSLRELTGGDDEGLAAIDAAEAELTDGISTDSKLTRHLHEMLSEMAERDLRDHGTDWKSFERIAYDQQKELLDEGLGTPGGVEPESEKTRDRAWYVAFNEYRKNHDKNDLFLQTVIERANQDDPEVAPTGSALRYGRATRELYTEAKHYQDQIQFLKDFHDLKVVETAQAAKQRRAAPPEASLNIQQATGRRRERAEVDADSQAMAAEYLTHALDQVDAEPQRNWLERIFSSRRLPAAERITAQTTLEEAWHGYHEEEFQKEHELNESGSSRLASLSSDQRQAYTARRSEISRSYAAGIRALTLEIEKSDQAPQYQLARLRARNAMLRRRNIELMQLLDRFDPPDRIPAIRPSARPFEINPTDSRSQLYQRTLKLEHFRRTHVLRRADFISTQLLMAQKQAQAAKNKSSRRRAEYRANLLTQEMKEIGRVLRDIKSELDSLPRLPKTQMAKLEADLPDAVDEAEKLAA